ncbi:MAG: exonuclease SbcCD subunit D [Pirellula sp.]
MRFLHTADWHLGRTLAGFDLLDSQAYTLEAMLQIAKDAEVDAIVMAGDIYDRSVPPEKAIELLDDYLIQLRQVAPILAIAGNHDSGSRIDFGRRLMKESGVYLAGTAWGGGERVDLNDEFGTVAFHLMPFALPVEVRSVLGDDAIRSHEDATKVRIANMDRSGTHRHVLIGHLFAQGGLETQDSERDIAVGGVASVPPSVFEGFNYTALGHLHRAHQIESNSIRYSGSICRYSFAEEKHTKSVSIVSIAADGLVNIEEVSLPQKYGMRTLQGTLEQIEQEATRDERRSSDLIRAVVTDHPIVPSAHGRLKAIYPHLLEFSPEIPEANVSGSGGTSSSKSVDTFKAISPQQQLELFFQDRFREQVNEAHRLLANTCMEQAIMERDPA